MQQRKKLEERKSRGRSLVEYGREKLAMEKWNEIKKTWDKVASTYLTLVEKSKNNINKVLLVDLDKNNF